MEREGDVSEGACSISVGDLPLLALTPFTTSAPIDWEGMLKCLGENSPYREFLRNLQSTNRKLLSIKWGDVPAVDVLQGSLDNNFDTLYRHRDSRKFLPSYSHPISEYIAAHKLLDHLARLSGTDIVSRNVLKHPKRNGYVGAQSHMNGLQNISSLLRDFVKVGDICSNVLSSRGARTIISADHFGLFPSSETQALSSEIPLSGINPERTDPLVAIAAELNGTTVAKKALKVVRNLGSVAFSIRLLMQGLCLSVPDGYDDLLRSLPPSARPQTEREEKLLREAMQNPRGLRQAFRLAVLVSPLLAISSGRELQKYSACPHEILLNSKWMGNMKPQVIEDAEDLVLVEILRIAEGKQTVVDAVIRLADRWRAHFPQLTMEENAYFDRPVEMQNLKYDDNMSLLDTLAVSPFPATWPLTSKSLPYVKSAGVNALNPERLNGVVDSSLDPARSAISGSSRDATLQSEEASASVVSPPLDLTPPSSKGKGCDSSLPPDDAEDGALSPAPDLQPSAPSHSDDDEEEEEEDEDQGGVKLGSSSTGDPRRSNRERQPPKQPTEPSWTKPNKHKGSSKKRQRGAEEAGNGDEEEEEEEMNEGRPSSESPPGISPLNIRSVHAKGYKKRRVITVESVLKMEEVEPTVRSIDVNEDTPLLVIGVPVERYSDSENFEFPAWDPDGNKRTLRLESHLESDFNNLKHILQAVNAQLCPTGRPRFIDDPENSVLRIWSADRYNARYTKEVQRVYGRQSIVVPRWSNDTCNFDRDALERAAADLKHKTSVQDFSVEVPTGNYNDRVRTGDLEQVYEASIAPPETRKSLNALFFPQPNSSINPYDPLASDSKAWQKTKSDLHCSADPHTGDVRWTIVATGGASHYFHVDPRGDGTFIIPLVGLKCWILAMPIDEDILLSAELWTKLEEDITKFDFTKWKVELILLRPGDLLVQLPHVSHAVYTPTHSICSGGHLIATSALRRSLLGVVHTFFCTGITNIDHPTFANRLNSLVCFFYKTITSENISAADEAHLPDIYSASGVMDLLLLACVIELQNALYVSSYELTTDPAILALLHQAGHTALSALNEFDISSMSHEMRVQNVYSRGRMQALLQYIFQTIVISTDDGEMRDPWGQLFVPVLAWFIECLKTYHNLAFAHLQTSACRKGNRRRIEHPAPRELFLLQLRSSTLRWDPLTVAVKELGRRKQPITTLMPPNLRIRVDRKSAANPSEDVDAGASFAPPDFRELGMRTLDGRYFTLYSELVKRA